MLTAQGELSYDPFEVFESHIVEFIFCRGRKKILSFLIMLQKSKQEKIIWIWV